MEDKLILTIIEEELIMAKQRIIQRLKLAKGLEQFEYKKETNVKNSLPENEKYRQTLLLIRQGMSQAEISRILKISQISVRRFVIWLINNGYLENEGKHELSQQEQNITALYDTGMTKREIAEKLGCTTQNVIYMINSAKSKGYRAKENCKEEL
jgi:DNA-binding CsgD family transcriptional regulator